MLLLVVLLLLVILRLVGGEDCSAVFEQLEAVLVADVLVADALFADVLFAALALLLFDAFLRKSVVSANASSGD